MSGQIDMNNKSKDLYKLARDLLAATRGAVAKSFFEDLPPVQTLKVYDVTASVLPIVSVLDDLGPTVPETSMLVTAVHDSAQAQVWRQPYTTEDFGADFAARTGWFAIADREGPLVMTEGLIEVMLLDAGLKYPLHSHAPEELYLVLAGEVWWQAEGDPEAPAWRRAGDLIHHPPHRHHALTAGDAPVLILALWRGGGFEKPLIA